MPDRDEALAILKRAREALLARMTEAIIEQADEIMADAYGESFLSEIETLYDQMGSKLAHLNQMIANLPVESSRDTDQEEPSYSRTDSPEAEQPRLPHFRFPVEVPTEEPAAVQQKELISLPAPGTTSGPPSPLGRFVSLIEQGDVDHAGDLIGQLLGLSPFTGRQCAQVFSARYEQDTAVVFKAMRIRQALADDQLRDALVLMHECFGLQGLDAMVALQRLRELIAKTRRDGGFY